MLKEYKILFFSVCAFFSYTLPFIFKSDAINIIYAIGTTFSIGGILLVVSWKLDKISHYYIMSAGIWFEGLSLIYLLDISLDFMFKSYYYVLFNCLITILTWFVIFLIRRFGSR